MIGARLSHFTITGALGRGGMGEVYRARDETLGREVAIKVLPEAFVTDPDRLARFEREARLLASLSHPHIAGIHEVGRAAPDPPAGGDRSAVHYLVMELAEGETLAERLERGPVPLDDAIPIAVQLAEALEAAHERGIVHRDLKPANLKVDADGKLKVLDFGLARAVEPRGEEPSPELSASPTLAHHASGAGMLIGTAAYMSPEQARGRVAGRQADIWAFGVVLFEMLAGRRLFRGDTVSDTVASVLREEVPWAALPDETPASVRRLLRRCLERDPKRRLRDAGDARLELLSPELDEERRPPVAAARKRAVSRLAPAIGFAAGAVSVAALLWIANPTGSSRPLVTRFELHGLGMNVDAFQGLALSPDGRSLVYRARPGQLRIRRLDAFESRPIPGTTRGWLPFFSPDSQRVGFFQSPNLMTVDLESGTVSRVAEALGGGGYSGGTWLPDDSIVFTPQRARWFGRVAASGGEVERLEIRDAPDVSFVVSPWALPDGEAVLCSAATGSSFDVAVYDLSDGSLRVVAKDGFTPVYVETGHVVYQQGVDGPLMAVPFDLDRRAATGAPVQVEAGIGTRVSDQVRMFSVATDGTLAYVPQSALLAAGALVDVSPEGDATTVVEVPRVVDIPRLSPDGRRVAFRAPAPECEIWVHDLERGTTTRATRDGDNHGVVWLPDGERLAFARLDGDAWGLWATRADGAGEPERLAAVELPPFFATSASPGGEWVLVQTSRDATGEDVDLVDVREGTSRTLLQSRSNERSPVLSPDGGLLAYVSDESGRDEVYVRPFPALDSRQQVSTDGGGYPMWSPGGEGLYFRTGTAMMVSDVVSRRPFRAGRPRDLFEIEMGTSGHLPAYDVTADGGFLMVRGRSGAAGAEVRVVLGWLEEVRNRTTRAASP